MAALAPTLIKLVDEGYEWVCKQFTEEQEPVAKPIKEINPLTSGPDRTPFTTAMKHRIVQEYNSYKRTSKTVDGAKLHSAVELTHYLNKILRLNKSVRSYSRVWNQK